MSVTLVTGCAGFMGMHCAQALLARGEQVVGIDNLNAYYEVSLKEARLARLLQHPGFTFERTDVADRQAMRALFERVRPTRVLHLAAQAGVRYSIDQPDDYTDSNLLGFGNSLQGCRPFFHVDDLCRFFRFVGVAEFEFQVGVGGPVVINGGAEGCQHQNQENGTEEGAHASTVCRRKGEFKKLSRPPAWAGKRR